ncbi:MAG: hypothetical protein U9R23_08130 [Candidatus Cloacimonadota bacterium]|nr:hypothetical protein [Candidatus Cloacimonadota bacterium]
MNFEDLKQEIEIELDFIESTISELLLILKDIDNKEPSTKDKTAAGTFLSQFYNGIENILKRISKYYNIELPKGENWHIELFKRFKKPSFKELPLLFDEPLATSLASYRKFRHAFFHGYGFQLDWIRIKEGIENVDIIYKRIKKIFIIS